MSALPPKADIRRLSWDVRFVPIADIRPFTQLSSVPDVETVSGSVALSRMPTALIVLFFGLGCRICRPQAEVSYAPPQLLPR
jgi:hypothetical protein